MPICFIDDMGDWGEAESLVAGADQSAKIVARVGINGDDGRRLRIDIAADADCVCFRDTRLIESIAYIGYGSPLFVIDVSSRHCASHAMRGYFGQLYAADDLAHSGENTPVLACSAADVSAFDEAGKLIWKSGQVGIDGVVLHKVSAGVLHGEGEWDPPGGWRPFTLSLDSGDAINV